METCSCKNKNCGCYYPQNEKKTPTRESNKILRIPTKPKPNKQVKSQGNHIIIEKYWHSKFYSYFLKIIYRRLILVFLAQEVAKVVTSDLTKGVCEKTKLEILLILCKQEILASYGRETG